MRIQDGVAVSLEFNLGRRLDDFGAPLVSMSHRVPLSPSASCNKCFRPWMVTPLRVFDGGLHVSQHCIIAVTYLQNPVFATPTICMRILREENQEVEFDLRPSEWLDSFDKNDLPHKLHNFVQAFTGAEAGVWFFLSRINARTMSLSSATSDETAGVEELVLILATTALFLD
ncbi:hypothetical protein Tco_0882097 [Tanacetum coccineum]